jgi:hypothetical protein
MPDFTRFRRLPVVLPPMIRTMDSTTPTKKSSGQPKTPKQKLTIKLDKAQLEKQKEKEYITRY